MKAANVNYDFDISSHRRLESHVLTQPTTLKDIINYKFGLRVLNKNKVDNDIRRVMAIAGNIY